MVWVWGDNKSATLGLNDYTNRTSPYLLAALKDKNISNIVFGSYVFESISNSDGGIAYYSSTPINLSFVPTVITFGVGTTNDAIPYAPSHYDLDGPKT